QRTDVVGSSLYSPSRGFVRGAANQINDIESLQWESTKAGFSCSLLALVVLSWPPPWRHCAGVSIDVPMLARKPAHSDPGRTKAAIPRQPRRRHHRHDLS